MEAHNAIIIILTVMILTLIFAVIKLNIQIYREKKSFKKKVKILKKINAQAYKNRFRHQNKLILSEELGKKLKTINTSLWTDIFELNKELVELLTKNSLI